MDEQHLPGGALLFELARGLDERLGFDVSDGAAYLRYDDIGSRALGNGPQPLLDGVGDVRDHLHRAAEEVAVALARDERLVDGALGEVGLAREGSRL